MAEYIGDPYGMTHLATTLIDNAEAFLANLQAQAATLAAPVINPSFPTAGAAPSPVTAALPTMQQVSWNVPTQPSAFSGSLNVSGLMVSPFTGTAPTLSFGTAPTPVNVSAPSSPSVDLNYTYPDVALTLPSAPTLLSLDTISFPDVTVPSFNVSVPTLTIATPNPFVYGTEVMATFPVLTQLEENLRAALTDGSYTTLTAQAQQALWDAAREREYRQQADALLALERDMETLGYAFPPGVFIDSRIKIQTETNNTIAGLSRDIAAKQAELQLQNIVEARKNATDLSGKLIDYANQIAQRAFDAAKYATQSAIEIYNAQVEKYKASLQGFTAQAQVYETQIKGLLAEVDIAKAQVAYEQTKAEINTAIVQQYKAEVEAAEAVLEIYRTQVQIIQTRAQVEKLKVDIFNAQIQAFVGQVNAYTAQVEGYKASIQAEATKQEAYKSSVEAYKAQVDASVSQINAQIAAFRGQIEAYTAQLQGYDSAVKGMIGQAQAASSYNTSQAEVYRAQVAAISSYNETITKQWQAILDEQERIAQIGVAAAKANGDLYIAARGLSLDASKGGAQVNAQLGAAALGAVSWHSNISSSYSVSNSQSSSFSNSTSTSTSTSFSTSNSTSSSDQRSTIDEQLAIVNG